MMEGRVCGREWDKVGRKGSVKCKVVPLVQRMEGNGGKHEKDRLCKGEAEGGTRLGSRGQLGEAVSRRSDAAARPHARI